MSQHEIETTKIESLSEDAKRELLLKLLKKKQFQQNATESAKHNKTFEKSVSPEREVAIIGVSCKFAGAENADQFWDNLAGGVSSITEVPEQRWKPAEYYAEDPRAEGKTNCKWGGFIDGADQFDPLFFNISPLEAEKMDPQQRLVLEHAWKTFDDAGYSRERLNNSNCGIYVGVMNNDYVQRLTNEFPAQEMMGRSNAILASRISFLLNLKGPAMMLDTACSSSMVALHLARKSILDGETDMMLAGGVTLYINPESYIMMSKAGMLSPNGSCIAFDANSNGFVPGEGVGILLLKRFDRAVEDGDHIYGVIKGSGINQDGKTNGITAPNPAAQEALQLEVFKRSGVNPDTVSMVETHGTSTPLGDPIEIDALRASFSEYTDRRDYCALGAVKNNIGHASAAAGIAGVIKVLKSMENAEIPPVTNFQRLNEGIELEGSPFYIPTKTRPWSVEGGERRRATVSSYGFSGTNSFMILEQAPQPEYPAMEHIPEYFAIPVSAKSEALLKESVRFLAAKLKRHSLASSGEMLQAVANTLYYEKNHERFRVCFLVEGEEDLFRAIEDFLTGIIPVHDIDAYDQAKSPGSRSTAGHLVGEKLARQIFSTGFKQDVLKQEDYLRFVAEYNGGRSEKPKVEDRPIYQRVPLPIVAFDRQSYWIDKPERDGLTIPAGMVRPSSHSAASSSQSSIVILRKEDRYLSDHIVNGAATLSGTSYLELIAKEYGRELFPVRYNNINWLRLVRVTENPIELEILKKCHDHKETYSFQVRGEVTASLGLDKELDIAQASFTEKSRDIGEFLKTAPFVFERAEIEGFFEKNGIHYGESFDYLEKVHKRGNELLGELVRPSQRMDPVSFAGILDAALRSVGLFYYHDGLTQRLPLSIASITQTASIEEAAYVHVSQRAASLFDIDILNELGQTFIKMESVRLAEKSRVLKPVFYLPGEMHVPTTAANGEGLRSGESLSDEQKNSRAKIFVVAGGNRIANALKELSSIQILAEHQVNDGEDEVTPNDDQQASNDFGSDLDLAEADTVFFVVGGEDRQGEELVSQLMFLLTLARHLQKLGTSRQRRNLVLLTCEAVVVPQSFEVDELAASFIGLARVIANEFTTLNVVHFDLSAEEEYGEGHQALLREISAGKMKNTALKTYRLSSGVAQQAITLPTSISPVKRSVFRQGGTYIIVGGARGIGYELALYLAGKYTANLVLLGRRDEDEAIRQKLRMIETVGGTARYYACDVTSEADLQEKVAEPEAAIGPIHGVVNSAVVFNDRSIARMERTHFEETFNSKFLSCRALQGVFGDRDLDFMLFFSSTQSFVGNPGQSNYGAGSTFKDASSHNRNLVSYYPIKTINWGYWGSVGAVASREMNERLQSVYGLEPLEVWEGMEAIERVLASQYQQVIVAKPGESGAAAMGLVSPEKDQVPTQSEIVSHKGTVKEHLKEIVGKILRIAPEKLDETTPFIDYGLDSVVGVSLANNLNDFFETELNPTAFFDYINVQQLAEHLEEQRGGQSFSSNEAQNPANTVAKVEQDTLTGIENGASLENIVVVSDPLDLNEQTIQDQAVEDENLFDEDFDLDNTEAAVVLERPGSVGQIKIKPVVVSDPEPNEIQIRIHAFSLNFGDLLCVKGLYPTMPRYPFTPGFEASGTIVKVGQNIKEFQPGEEVIAMFGDGLGGQSTLINTNTDYVVHKPANISHEDACAFGVVFVTIAHAFDRAEVRPGESVLIQTAAGGVGLVSVQMARQAGAEIFATAGSTSKLDYLRGMGVKNLINYQEEDFQQKVLALTGGRGVDVVINTLSGDFVQKGLDILAAGGRYIEIAPVALKSGQGLDLSNLTDNQTLISIDMRRLMLRDKQQAKHYLCRMSEALLEQTVVPTVGATYSLLEIREAYRHLENRKNIGKVVVRNPNVDDAPLISTEAARKQLEAKGTVLAVEQTREQMRPYQGSLETGRGTRLNQERAQGTEIAIIGMSGMFAGAEDLDVFWKNLSQGISSIGEIPESRWKLDGFFDSDQETPDRSYGKWGGFLKDIDQFDPVFFGLSGKEASLMDPQQRLFLQTSWNALDHAGYANDRVSQSNCSVFVGVGESEYKWRMEESSVEKQAQAFWSNEASVLAARVSYFLDLKGASIAVNTACSSSLVAVDLACKSLASGESEMAIAGGVSVYNHPSFFILSSKAGMLADDGRCKAFDDSANGFVPGEGVGAIILKPLDAALKDGDHILGKIIAHGVNQDGKTNGITSPNGQSQQRLEESIYQKFKVDPGSISYIEAHGTGTRLGDPIEVNALTKAFRKYTQKKQFCGIGSVKTNIGHATTAAGIAGILKVLLSLQHNKLPPTLNFHKANQLINFSESPFYVNASLRDWEPGETARRAAISSFSFSGTNAHLVIEEAPSLELMDEVLILANMESDSCLEISKTALRAEKEGGESLVLISASNSKNLREYARCLAKQIRADEGSKTPLENLAYTSQVHRKHLSHRHGFFVSSLDELLLQIDDWLRNGTETQDVAMLEQAEARESKLDSETIERWIVERNIKAIYQAWAAESDVNWARLYPGSVKRKVPMPPHIFNKKRYWFEAAQAKSNTANKSKIDEVASPINLVNHLNLKSKESGTMEGMNNKPRKIKLKNTKQPQHEATVQTETNSPTQPLSGDSTVTDSMDASSIPSNQIKKQEDISAALKVILAGILMVDANDIAWKKNFSDLGVDSIMGVEFVKGINREFGTNLSASSIFDYPYIKELAAYLHSVLPKSSPAAQVQKGSQAQIQGQAPGQASVPGRDEENISAALKVILAGILMVDTNDIAWKKNFSDLGVDSIMGVEFVKGINREFGTNLSASSIFDYPHIKELAAHIHPLLSQAPVTVPRQSQTTAKISQPEKASSLQGETVESPVKITQAQFTSTHDQSGTPPTVQPGEIAGNLIQASSFLSEVSWQSIEVREPRDYEVQIDVVASAINFADILCVKGMYPTMPPYPFVTGFEVSGIVKQVGRQVRSVKMGDPVLAFTGMELGGHADVVNVKEGLFIKKPDNLSFAEAASLPVVFSTAYYALVNLAKINVGDLVLIQIAAGGVGQMAVALAKKFGAKVIGTSSSEEKLDYLRLIGVEHAINYQADDFSEQVQRASGGRGVDIVLNSLGGEMIQKGLDALAPGGRYIELAVAGLKSATSLSLAGLTNNQSFFSFDLRKLTTGDTETVQTILEHMNRYIISGELIPPPIKVFSSHSIREALEYLDARHNIGKVVLAHKDDGFKHKDQSPQSWGDILNQLRVQNPVQSQSPDQVLQQRQHPNLNWQQAHQSKDIAIIGMSGRFPGAKNVDEFWKNLTKGLDSVGEVPAERWDTRQYFDTDRSVPAKTYSKWGAYLEDADKFDPSFFSLTPKEAELMDPQHRLFLQEAWKAVEDAGYSSSDWSNKTCGVFVGANPGDYVERLRSNVKTMNSQLLSGNSNSMLPARPAYFMNLKGPAVTIDTACSSSLMAVHQACTSILTGECETAIAGGVSVLVTPEMHILTSKAGMLSEDGKCKTFDNAANGFVQGEGVGVVVLKKLEEALQDNDFIYGVIKASGSNQDGKSNGIMAPNSLAQSSLQSEVYQKYGINPDDISYIEAHGTGTKLGDPIEIEALTRSMNSEQRVNQSCPIGSVKTNIGHSLASAGIAGLIKVLLCLKHKELVPSLHYHTANEHIRFDETPFYVNTEHCPWNPPKKRMAAINSFGFSGTNCHLVIEEAPERASFTKAASPASSPGEEAYYVVPFSAVDELSLQHNLANLKQWLETSTASIELIASTLRNGREHFEIRSVALARSAKELHEILTQVLSGEVNDFYLSKATEAYERELPRSTPVTDYHYCRIAAEWYLDNKDFQWQEVFPASEEIKIPLPTYEFLKESYWIESSRQQWQVTSSAVDGDQEMKAFCIDKDDYIIGDHLINQRKVVPGAAFVSSMVSQLIPDDVERTGFSLQQIQWHRQFVIAPQEDQADLCLQKTGGRRVDIYSDTASQNSSGNIPPEEPELIRYVSAEIDTSVSALSDSLDELRKEFNVAGLRSRCNERVSKDEIYPTLSEMGVHFGPSFQVVEKCYFNQQESISFLEAPSQESQRVTRPWILPNLLDGALQSVYGVKSTLPEYRDLTMIPVTIESLQVFAKMPKSLMVVSRLRGAEKYVYGATLTFDLLLLDEFESPVMCIRGYQQKSVYGGGPAAKQTEISGKETIGQLNTFRAEWQASRPQANLGSMASMLEGKNLLIVGANDHFTQHLIQRLPNTQITRVSYGFGYQELKNSDSLFCQFDIPPSDPRALERVVERLEEMGFPANYVFFLTQLPSDITVETIDSAMEAYTLAQFSLLKGLLRTSARENLDYLCLYETENTQELHPLVYGLNGFFKTLNKENPRVRPKLVFFSRGDSPVEEVEASRNQAVSISLEELGIDYRQEESTILWQGNSRLIRVLRESSLQEVPDTGVRPAGIVRKGTYLITGGLGHIGRAIAERLASHYQANIALVGRREPSPADREFLDSLNRTGASASYFQGEVTDFQQTHRLISEVRKTLGEINGVFHTAGVLRDRYFIEKESTEFLYTLRPKVTGTLALHKALRSVPLEFFALFSSTAGHTGNQAQCDYAYANSFLDGFASWRNSQVNRKKGHFGRTLSLGWALWEAGGMYIDSDKVLSFIEQDIGIIPLPREVGIQALEKALLSGESYSMLINGHPARLRASFGVMDEAGSYYETGITGDADDVSHSGFSGSKNTMGPDKASASDAGNMTETASSWTDERLREETRAFLIDTVSETLKLPKRKITLKKTFDKYGIDSVVIVELNRILESHFRDLPKTLFFEYNSIEGMSDYFVNHHPESLRKLFAKTHPVAEAPLIPSPVEGGTMARSAVSNTLSPHEATATAAQSGMAGVTFSNISSDAPQKTVSGAGNQTTNSKLSRGTSESIAIVGVSGKYPKADDLDAFWKNLSAGVDCIEEIPPSRWDYRETYQVPGEAGETVGLGKSYSKWGGFINGVDEFDPLFFNISPREAEYLDPQERLFLQCAWHTVEDAGYRVSELNNSVGVFVGVMWGQYQFFGVEESLKSPSLVSSSSYASIANRVSYFMNLKGPSMAVDSMCSSSLSAIHLACQAIRSGECDTALAGGVNVTIHPNKYIQLSQGKFASTDGRCRSFGEGGDGYVPSEGVGAVLLKPLSQAVNDQDHIYAVIRGSALNHVGKTNGYTVPSPNAQAEVIRAAIDRAGVDPRSIQYIEAHGTGTALGDPIEITGLAKALPELANHPQSLPIGSVKSMVGHLESAAGIAGLTKLLLQLKHRQFVGSLHSESLNPNIDFQKTPFFVQRELTHWPENIGEFNDQAGDMTPRRAALSSFGAGGSNAHFILEEGPARKNAALIPEKATIPFPVSARSRQRLKDYVENLILFIEQTFGAAENPSQENDGHSADTWRDLIEPMKEVMTEAIAESLGVSSSDLSLSDKLDDYGVDTLAITQMERQIARKLNVKVTLKHALSVMDNLQTLAQKEESALRQTLGLGEASSKHVVISESNQEYLNLAYTFQTAREEYAERLVVLASNPRQLYQRLKSCLDFDLDHGHEDCYRGKVGDADTSADIEEVLERAHQNRDAKLLAECWVKGEDVDWAVLYPETKPLRIPAPGYPFARDRYWMSVTSHAALLPGIGANAQAEPQGARRYARQGLENDYVAPNTDLEKMIANVWEEVLGIEQMGLYDDFFEIGGNSIASMDIIARLRKRINIELKLGQFMEASTVSAVAQMIEKAGGSLITPLAPRVSSTLEDTSPKNQVDQIIPSDLSKTRFPLSFGQNRFWFLNTLNPDNPVYNLTTYVDFRGPELNVSVFEQSYQAMLQRHGALRTRFVEDQDGIAQIIEATGKNNLEWVDLRGRAVTETEVKSLTDRETMEPLNFIEGVSHKLVVYRISNERFGLYLKTHHILSDAWSMGIFLQELIELYSARMGNRSHVLPETDVHFGHYSEWSAERLPRVVESQLPYWVDKLKGIPEEPGLPLDYERPNRGIFSASHLTFHLPKERLEQLEHFAKKNKVSLFVTLLSAFNVVLRLFSQQDDIVVGFPVSNRPNQATENMLGFLTNTLVFRTDLSGNPAIKEMIDHVKQVTYDAFDHSEVPFAKIVEAIKPKRAINFNPVFQVMFNMIPDLVLLPEAEFEGTVRDDPPAAIDFDLMLRVTQKSDSLLGTLHYAKDLFSAETAQAYVDRFLQVIDEMVGQPTGRLADLGRTNTANDKGPEDKESAKIVVSSTFTIDPITESLDYWSQKFEKNFKITLAPYNQVYNQLLDPRQETLLNEGGINLMVIKFDDWTKEFKDLSLDEMISVSNRAFESFTAALKQADRELSSPLLLMIGPSDYSRLSHAEERRRLYQGYGQALVDCVNELGNVTLLSTESVAELYGTRQVFDPGMDANGHIPYSFEYFHALGTAAFRCIYGVTRKAHKVIVLDCDQTLWRGVLGEDGIDGVIVDESRKRFQRKLIEQVRAGVLLCLCSKNDEQDVLKVFREHPDMELRLEHIVAHRVNWKPKPQNIEDLADQLNLSTDSFIFIDDNPTECEQMRVMRPEVLTLRIPERPEEIDRFVDHAWYFDHYRITEEDGARTQMMLENIAREEDSSRYSNFADFVDSLNLEIEIEPVTNLSRASQLLARTNQFNSAGVRLSIEELEGFRSTPGNTVFGVRVKDRFGNYGLVGCLLISERIGDIRELNLVNMVLSCRTLGKGVEYRMLQHFAEIAWERGIDRLSVDFKKTDRNRPVLDFLFSLVKSGGAEADEPMGQLLFTTGDLKELKFDPVSYENLSKGNSPKVKNSGIWTNLNQRLMEIAEQGVQASRIADELKAQSVQKDTPKTASLAASAKSDDILTQIRARRMSPQMRRAMLSPQPQAEEPAIHSQATTNGNGSGNGFAAEVSIGAGMNFNGMSQEVGVAPKSAEETVSSVFKDIMGVDYVSLSNNYFDIGVQSMDLVKICSRLQDIYQREVPIELMFQYTSIRALASYLGEVSETNQQFSAKGTKTNQEAIAEGDDIFLHAQSRAKERRRRLAQV